MPGSEHRKGVEIASRWIESMGLTPVPNFQAKIAISSNEIKGFRLDVVGIDGDDPIIGVEVGQIGVWYAVLNKFLPIYHLSFTEIPCSEEQLSSPHLLGHCIDCLPLNPIIDDEPIPTITYTYPKPHSFNNHVVPCESCPSEPYPEVIEINHKNMQILPTRYKMRHASARSIEAVIPFQICKEEAKRRNFSVDEFLGQYQIEFLYGSFDGAYFHFVRQ